MCTMGSIKNISQRNIWDLSQFFKDMLEMNLTAQKMKFSIKDSSVNVTKSAVNFELDLIYWRNL